jgi:hypothetical protein
MSLRKGAKFEQALDAYRLSIHENINMDEIEQRYVIRSSGRMVPTPIKFNSD